MNCVHVMERIVSAEEEIFNIETSNINCNWFKIVLLHDGAHE